MPTDFLTTIKNTGDEYLLEFVRVNKIKTPQALVVALQKEIIRLTGETPFPPTERMMDIKLHEKQRDKVIKLFKL